MENQENLSPAELINPNLPMAWGVVIEWDGERPPTRWYNRLKEFNLTIRGDGTKEQSPLARRVSGNGIAHQEGALIVESESLARTLAHLAREMGATVSYGRIHFEELLMSHEDETAIRRITSTLGRRGRPPANDDWVVTCMDEGKSFEMNCPRPVNCPSCGGFKIQTKLGMRPVLNTIEYSHDLVTSFMLSHFVAEYYIEPKVMDTESAVKFDKLNAQDTLSSLVDLDKSYLAKLSKSTLVKELEKFYQEGKINLGDAMDSIAIGFYALMDSVENRQKNRLNAITEYFRMGFKQNGLKLSLDPEDIDIFEIVKGLWVANNPLGKRLFYLYDQNIK